MSAAKAGEAASGLQVIVTGTVFPTCEVATGVSLIFSDVTSEKIKNIEIPFSCNAPYALTLVSANGGLKRIGGDSVGIFSKSLDYTIAALIPFDNGTSKLINRCSSTVITAEISCGLLSTQGRSSIAQSMNIAVEIGEQKAPLLSGEYLDRLRIKFSAEI